jgi:CBS domain containing-hemolysin-like protein
VVTLEDLLEELVGPIDDEHNIPSPADPVREPGGSRYDVDATLALDELNLRLGVQLPTVGEFQTIGGLVFHELRRAPTKSDRVNAHGVALTVVDVSDYTIRRVMIDLAPEISAVETARSVPGK